MSNRSKILIAAIIIFLGISALASGSLPFSFKAGDPISADEVNANFTALNDGKQNTITGSPCGDGQFVTGIAADGAMSCGVDQIGSAGSSGVSSLNGQTGSLAIEGGEGVSITSTDDGIIKVNLTNDTGFSTQAAIALPGTGTIKYNGAAFAVRNNSTQNFSSAISGTANAAGAFGVLGSSSAGQGIRGNASSGTGVVGTSTSGIGIAGSSASGDGIRGSTTSGSSGVYGINTSTKQYSAGVRGQSNAAVTVGVYGSSTSGYGTAGITTSGTGVWGQVNGPTTAPQAAGVSGINGGTYGFGVRGEHKGLGYGVYGTAPQVGVGGESATGIGVRGIGPVAMSAQGNAVQNLGAFGWAKAMVYVDQTNIIRCFNSQATSNTLMNSNGCGFRITLNNRSSYDREIRINFGFDTSKTFPLLTIGSICDGDAVFGQCSGQAGPSGTNEISVTISDLDDDPVDRWSFYLILF